MDPTVIYCILLYNPFNVIDCTKVLVAMFSACQFITSIDFFYRLTLGIPNGVVCI